MAGVLEQLIRPQKRAVVHRTSWADLKVLELVAAKGRFRAGDVRQQDVPRREITGKMHLRGTGYLAVITGHELHAG